MSLPPGVTDSMIPGNTPEDVEWERILDAILPQMDDLLIDAQRELGKSKLFINDDATLKELLQDALHIAITG